MPLNIWPVSDDLFSHMKNKNFTALADWAENRCYKLLSAFVVLTCHFQKD